MSTTTARRSLAIAIIGAGRIGSSFAYQLAHAGHDVTLIARPDSKRLVQLRRDNAVILSSGARAPVTVEDHLDELEPYDLVVVAVNAHQVDGVLPALKRSKAQKIQFMFVTTEAARLATAVGKDRASFGLAGVLATISDKGKLNLQISSRTKAMHSDQRWVELFETAGMPSRHEPDMGRWLRSHAPLTIAMESVASAGMAHKRGATWAEAKTGAKGLRSAYAILKGLGETPYPAAKKRISSAPRPLLTFILWAASRSRFREAIGNSDGEVTGLIDLLVAEGTEQRQLSKDVAAIQTLRPTGRATSRATRGSELPLR